MTDRNNANRLVILSVWLLGLLACGWVVLFKLQLITNVTQFMPPAKTPAEKLLLEQLHQGAAARIILMAIEGGDLKTTTTASKALAKQLRGHEIFTRVDNGEKSLRTVEDTPLFRYRYLLSLGLTRISHQQSTAATDASNLTGCSPSSRLDVVSATPAPSSGPSTPSDRRLGALATIAGEKCGLTAGQFSPEALHAALQQRLLDLTSPFALFNKQLLPQDPTNETGALLQQLLAQDKTHSQFGVWVSPDQRRALLLAETRAQGYDVPAQTEAIGAIRAAFNLLLQEPANHGLRLMLSGPAVFAVNSQHQIQREVTWLSTLASVAVMLILWIAYRSLRLVVISAIPLASALLAASAALTMVFGPIHGITLAFGVTVIGVAIDYPIHLFSHLSGKHSVNREFKTIWPTMRLGVITTIAGYSAMTATHFTGLVQLGLFAMIGLLTAAVVTRWVLPAMLPRHFAPVADHVMQERFTRLLHPGSLAAVIPILLGIAAIVVIGLKSAALWENDLAALSPIPKQQLLLDRQLRNDLGAPDASHLVVVSAPTAEAALQQSESLYPWLDELKQQGAISDFDAASRYLPSRQRQQERQQQLPDKPRLHAALSKALQDLPFKQAQFKPFVEAVAHAKNQPPVTLEDLQGSALGVKVQSLLLQTDSRWTALILLYGVAGDETIAAGVPPQSGVYYLNFRAATNRLMQAFRAEALARMQWAALFIVLVLAVGIRGPQRRIVTWLAVLLPVSLAITVTIALLLLMGQSLSLFNLVALLLVFGIGIDFGLFFSRQEAEQRMRQRTFHALSVCALSTVSVFGILSLSAVPVLRDIGITVWIGVLLSFIFALLLSQRAAARPTTA